MTEHLQYSFFISSSTIEPDIKDLKGMHVGGYMLGYFSDRIQFQSKANKLAISFADLIDNKNLHSKQNTACVEDDILTVYGSDMNTQSIYFIRNNQQIVIFNDLYLGRFLLKCLGYKARYDRQRFSEDLTFFEPINRLQAGEQLVVRKLRQGLEVVKHQVTDILHTEQNSYDNIQDAQQEMYRRLSEAVAQQVHGHETINIALSGGIDSGTIAYLARQQNCNLKAYTVSTDWGNECRAAKETADYLGIELKTVHLTRDEIVAEIPKVIRFFYFVESENIEIALVAHCLYKKLYEEDSSPRIFITGYGSDLLNAGVFRPFSDHSQLHAEIIARLKTTQSSNEFSNLASMHYGVNVFHPFWDQQVITCAMRVPATYKVVEGQDKFYFRQMMENKLPHSTVWRKKLGAHHGTGLSQYLHQVFGHSRLSGRGGYQHRINEIHEEIFAQGKYE